MKAKTYVDFCISSILLFTVSHSFWLGEDRTVHPGSFWVQSLNKQFHESEWIGSTPLGKPQGQVWLLSFWGVCGKSGCFPASSTARATQFSQSSKISCIPCSLASCVSLLLSFRASSLWIFTFASKSLYFHVDGVSGKSKGVSPIYHFLTFLVTCVLLLFFVQYFSFFCLFH